MESVRAPEIELEFVFLSVNDNPNSFEWMANTNQYINSPNIRRYKKKKIKKKFSLFQFESIITIVHNQINKLLMKNIESKFSLCERAIMEIVYKCSSRFMNAIRPFYFILCRNKNSYMHSF